MGNTASIDPTYCGGKEIFKKSYEGVIHLEKRAKNVGATGVIRTLFAPANKDDVDKRRDSVAQLETTAENAVSLFCLEFCLQAAAVSGCVRKEDRFTRRFESDIPLS